MTPEERALVIEWARGLLEGGREDHLVVELAESGMAAEVWSDPDAAAALFELHGSLAATSTLLDACVLRPGSGAFVFPLPGGAQPPGHVVGASIAIDGVLVGGSKDVAVVGTDRGDALRVPGLDARPITGFDPQLRLVRVQGIVPLADCAPVGGPLGWDVLAARAARAVAYQLVGLAAAARAVATRHVRERHQFGRPIGAFQSVRHRLADALIAETGARELLAAVGEPLDPEVERLVIKAAAGVSALLAVRAAQQVCGAMGFTAEFGLHRLVRRAYLLDSLLGGSEDAEEELAARALATGRAPSVAIAF